MYSTERSFMKYAIERRVFGQYQLLTLIDDSAKAFDTIVAAREYIDKFRGLLDAPRVIPLVTRKIGDRVFDGSHVVTYLANGSTLYVDHLFTKMSRNGNGIGYLRLFVENENGNIENVSRELARWFKYNEKYNCITTSQHGTWVSTVKNTLTPHFETEVVVKQTV